MEFDKNVVSELQKERNKDETKKFEDETKILDWEFTNTSKDEIAHEIVRGEYDVLNKKIEESSNIERTE